MPPPPKFTGPGLITMRPGLIADRHRKVPANVESTQTFALGIESHRPRLSRDKMEPTRIPNFELSLLSLAPEIGATCVHPKPFPLLAFPPASRPLKLDS
jgi:hypothetical protein